MAAVLKSLDAYVVQQLSGPAEELGSEGAPVSEADPQAAQVKEER